MLTFRVQSTCRLVKKQNTRFSNQRSRNGDSLLLTARETHASFTNDRIESVREKFLILDELQTVGLTARMLKSLLDLLWCETFQVDPVKNVLPDRP